MSNWRNATGKPLASSAWLDAHHRAKLPERRRFAESLARLRPRRVVDLGCATGLWLDLLDAVLPPDCEFVGLDSDEIALEEARARASKWSRSSVFETCDLESDLDDVPGGDLTLMFNVIPYIEEPAKIFARLAEREDHGVVAVRQYDGAALRFGPMETDVRALIEQSLRSGVSTSRQFRHYDMDRVFSLIRDCAFDRQQIAFELFERTAPFPPDFVEYFEGTLAWTQDLLSEDAARHLERWAARFAGVETVETYFFEVDVTAVLS
jgi:SAM-dependent methyltransferase